MAEAAKDTGAETPAAGDQPAESGETKGAQGAEATEQDVQATVPMSVVKALRDEMKGLKESNQTLESQVNLYKTQQQFMQSPQGYEAPAKPPEKPAEDPLNGIGDDDLLTGKQMKNILSGMKQPDMSAALNPINQRLALMEVRAQDPDFENTIKTYLPEIVNSNPSLMAAIRGSENPIATALALAKTAPAYVAAQQQSEGQQPQQGILSEIDKIIENASKPGSASQVTGGGATATADRFGSMTDAEFNAHVERVKAGKT